MSLWDALEKAAYTGLGLAAMSKEKLDEAVDVLKRERGLTEDEGRRIAEDLKDGAESARRKLDERVAVAVEKALSSTPFATRKEVDELKAKIAELEGRIDKNGT